MSGWELATWAAIAVLVVGSLAVFGWFLADVRSILGADSGEDASRSDSDGAG